MGLKKKIMITLQVNNDAALETLKSLAKKRHIKIIEEIDLNSPALPGSPFKFESL